MARGKRGCGGKPQRGRDRGRHKHGRSPETKRWNAEHLLPPRPPWMDAETYRKLAERRDEE
jgi:hypothetical protein